MQHDGAEFSVKEYEERTLNAARLCFLLREEREVDDPWHIVVLSLCAFERMHTKESWEYVLTHKKDIEDVAALFETSSSPDEFRAGLLKLKERDLQAQIARAGLK
ncbi:hypothetical protein [Rubrobacter indicoceani]|uniref:hypothetical protein n=1 Tax=Rubrobacter indicoceani TaxID=2051957 RepID=UPI000E5C091E|nr:hypothetical protein [Rubrobacter indicoceani]